MLHRIILFLFFLTGVKSLYAQENYIISGRISDGKNPIPGASVYLASHKITTQSDGEGRFSLPPLPAGNYHLLIQMIGFKPASEQIVLSDRPVQVSIKMIESPILLNAVEIKPDPNRAFYLQFFTENFIGKTLNAKQCKILNPEVLSFDDNKEDRILRGTASDFLLIENKALGYQLRYLLQDFEYDYGRKIIYYAGFPHFEEMKGTLAQKKRWTKNRALAYYGSARHFFSALYHNNLEKEGFILYKQQTIPNPQRLDDSLINAQIKRLTSGQREINKSFYFQESDSVMYWFRQRGLPSTVKVIQQDPVHIDTLVKNYDKNRKMMHFADALYVLYQNEKESAEFSNSALSVLRPRDIKNVQISTAERLTTQILFYASGAIYDPKSMLYGGYWAFEKMADAVPEDYLP